MSARTPRDEFAGDAGVTDSPGVGVGAIVGGRISLGARVIGDGVAVGAEVITIVGVASFGLAVTGSIDGLALDPNDDVGLGVLVAISPATSDAVDVGVEVGVALGVAVRVGLGVAVGLGVGV